MMTKAKLTKRQTKDLDHLAELLKGASLQDVQDCVCRDQRINIRVTQREKDLLEHLAKCSNTNTTQLVVGLAELVTDRLAGTPKACRPKRQQ